MIMKFDIKKLHETRLSLEKEIKSLKLALSQPHDTSSAGKQVRKQILRERLTFIYTAIAYSRQKVHANNQTADEQAEWLIKRISAAKLNLQNYTRDLNLEWLTNFAFATMFFNDQIRENAI